MQTHCLNEMCFNNVTSRVIETGDYLGQPYQIRFTIFYNVYSSDRSVLSGVPQCSVLGPLLFLHLLTTLVTHTNRQVDKDLLSAGKVKANAEKFISGVALENSDDESESADRDPNIIRGSKKAQKVELNFENVGDIKNKWKEGNVETAEAKEAPERKELEALKGGVSVKDRFKERDGNDEQVVERSWNKDELSTSGRSFL
ncbi:hypothetical protein CRE_24358 [Caenorhabditis remanei]|uniref:Uncharacterized protein n=1 Tax=Caenorhabditis remanei TaxID=31234 RepID=E3NUR2_CAERE|nr:hypothetical protein CRE_24358 [Caenorhabditis remanei]